MIVNKYVYSNMSYDPLTAFSHVALVAELPNVLMVRNQLGVNSVAELVALAKRKDLSFGSPDVGSSGHVSSEPFNLHSRIKATHIPYKGSAPMLGDLAGGSIDYSIDQISSAFKLIQGGQIKALAVTSKERSPELPNVATLREAGLSNYEVSVWFCIAALAKSPPEIVATLNSAINKVLKAPAVIQRISGFAARPLGGSAADLTRQVQIEQQNIVAVAKVVNFSNQQLRCFNDVFPCLSPPKSRASLRPRRQGSPFTTTTPIPRRRANSPSCCCTARAARPKTTSGPCFPCSPCAIAWWPSISSTPRKRSHRPRPTSTRCWRSSDKRAQPLPCI